MIRVGRLGLSSMTMDQADRNDSHGLWAERGVHERSSDNT
jgi:hypothetical protein